MRLLVVGLALLLGTTVAFTVGKYVPADKVDATAAKAEETSRAPAAAAAQGPAAKAPTADAPAAGTPAKAPSYNDLLAEVAPGQFDPLSIPMSDGIVWYGTWEDAMAEKERTGKPVMLHFGSPRCPSKGVCVPGTW